MTLTPNCRRWTKTSLPPKQRRIGVVLAKAKPEERIAVRVVAVAVAAVVHNAKMPPKHPAQRNLLAVRRAM